MFRVYRLGRETRPEKCADINACSQLVPMVQKYAGTIDNSVARDYGRCSAPGRTRNDPERALRSALEMR